MSTSSQKQTGSRKAYLVARVGYFRDECTVLARNEEEAEELACNIGDWETVYHECDYTEIDPVILEADKETTI